MIMKKYFFLAACCMLAVGFTACDNGDDDNGDEGNGSGTSVNGGSGTSANSTPNVSESLGIEHLVTSIRGGENSTFHYSNGKMTDGVTDGNTNFVITENPLKINMSYISEYESENSNFTDIKTNSNGFITYLKGQIEEVYYDDTYNSTGEANLEYDGDGHLIKMTTYATEDGYSYTTPTTFTWVNGNLTEMVNKYEESEYGMTFSETTTYTFEYNDNTADNPNPGIFFEGMDYELYDFMWYAGLLGKHTKNIPTKITRKSVEKENGEITYEYSWSEIVDVTYNPNGSVASITYTETNNGYQSTVYYDYNGEQAESNIQAGISSKTIKSPRKMHRHRK